MSVVNDVYKIAKYISGDFRAFKFREFSSEIAFFFNFSAIAVNFFTFLPFSTSKHHLTPSVSWILFYFLGDI